MHTKERSHGVMMKKKFFLSVLLQNIVAFSFIIPSCNQKLCHLYLMAYQTFRRQP